ncbi:peroxisomal biogenesis factor 11 [Dactylonectria macrodidyma]|uniref:Peroxisomal biogenesis factor 11 n=1 Tax=Dactylonectria macrodidyma TaxID=307937 RepID=A0A9P9IS01_9HYPO|nr:peroxisomal biogenesis factor 11 [Dactylonectria macrodidyma]
MAFNLLDHSRTIVNLIQCLATALSRDKLLRLTQFFARFYAWFLSRRKCRTRNIATWKLVMKQAALIRRLSRLGNNIQYFQVAIQTFLAKDQDPVLLYAAIGRQLGLAGFLTCDAAIALDTLDMWRLKSTERVHIEASRLWSIAVLCNIIAGGYELCKLQQQQRTGEKVDAVSRHRHMTIERKFSQLQLFSDLCDLIIATSPLLIVRMSDGVIGICGIISTIASMCISQKNRSQLN